MEKKKVSFILYNEYYEMIKELPTDQKGLLLCAIFEYSTCGNEIELPAMARIIFKLIKKRMDYDTARYKEICEARSAAGSQGGRPKKQEVIEETDGLNEKAKKANGFFEKQNNQIKAKKADIDNDMIYDINNPPNGSPLNVDNFVDNSAEKDGREEEKIYIGEDYTVAWDDHFTEELRALSESQVGEINYWLQKHFKGDEIPVHLIRNALLTKAKRENQQAANF